MGLHLVENSGVLVAADSAHLGGAGELPVDHGMVAQVVGVHRPGETRCGFDTVLDEEALAVPFVVSGQHVFHLRVRTGTHHAGQRVAGAVVTSGRQRQPVGEFASAGMPDFDGPRRRCCERGWFAEWWASMATSSSLNVTPDGAATVMSSAIRGPSPRSDASVSAHRTLPTDRGLLLERFLVQARRLHVRPRDDFDAVDGRSIVGVTQLGFDDRPRLFLDLAVVGGPVAGVTQLHQRGLCRLR